MRITKIWQVALMASAVLFGASTASYATTPKADTNSVIRPNGKGQGVVDENATRAARRFGIGQPVRGRKDGPVGIYPFWQPDVFYTAGSVVAYNGYDYQAVVNQTNYANTGANPTVPTLWTKLQRDNRKNNGIYYHGGDVMTAPIPVYFIWYGNWSAHAKAQTILRNFVGGLGNTPAWNIFTTYYDRNNKHVTNQIYLAGEVVDNYSQGRVFDEESTQHVVANALKNGSVPLSGSAVYMVYTSPDIPVPGFGDIYCGLHTSFMHNGVDVKFAFVGNPIGIAPNACGLKSPSPNNDAVGDAMVTVTYHELAEIAVDPDLNAWYDDSVPLPPIPAGTPAGECSPNGYEIGDKCVWQFGTTKLDANGAEYNHTINGHNYLLQMMWLNAKGGMCVQGKHPM